MRPCVLVRGRAAVFLEMWEPDVLLFLACLGITLLTIRKEWKGSKSPWLGRKTNLRTYFCLGLDLPGPVVCSLWHCDPWLPGPGYSSVEDWQRFADSLIRIYQMSHGPEYGLWGNGNGCKIWTATNPRYEFCIRIFPNCLTIVFNEQTRTSRDCCQYNWNGNGTFEAWGVRGFLQQELKISFEGFIDLILQEMYSRTNK
jgi:hypothetical protein